MVDTDFPYITAGWCIIQIEGFDDDARPNGRAMGAVGKKPEDFRYFLFEGKEEAERFLDVQCGPISRETHATVWLNEDNVAKLKELACLHEGDLAQV